MENTRQKLPCLHKDSQVISKMKPKIRIIHIFAPEIIKTDVANFRELVQRLTGKPTSHDRHHHHKKGFKNKVVKHSSGPSTNSPGKAGQEVPDLKKLVETKNAFLGFGMLKEEVEEDYEMMWKNNGGSSGGFLGGFSDLECNYGFIQELGEQFPLLPHHHHLMHGFEETQVT